MPLCPTCHCEYDRISSPGLVIVPMDIQYFINFEAKNQEMRKQTGNARDVPRRHNMPPTVRMNTPNFTQTITQEHMDFTGGFFLTNYIAPFFVDQDKITDMKPLQWPGAPMATFRHAFTATMSASSFIYKHASVVRELQSLYMAYFASEVDVDENGGKSNNDSGEESSKKRKRPTQEDQPEDQPEGYQNKNTSPRKPTNPTESHFKGSYDIMMFGPNMNTLEAIRRWAHICH
ncbi:hypothetical protein N7495_006331 [Penicillium taxi]|uniref:uncharacterized protein n=1 Tax=Penicillium taxi TaxID=168475 RepID=UPI002544DC8C|nr:uncharacterized protein N7495_006331 [Penicillium taxi]KAJ5894640.1 hypothetical protein N7495_006331 [Penicillium taxi]